MDADLTWWRQYSEEVKRYHAARDLPVPTGDESGPASSDVGMAAAAHPAGGQAGRPQEATAVLAAEIQAFSARMLTSMQEVQGQMQSLTGALAAQQAQTAAHATALTALQAQSVPLPNRASQARAAAAEERAFGPRARSERPARSQSRARSAAPTSQPSQPALVNEPPVATGAPALSTEPAATSGSGRTSAAVHAAAAGSAP